MTSGELLTESDIVKAQFREKLIPDAHAPHRLAGRVRDQDEAMRWAIVLEAVGTFLAHEKANSDFYGRPPEARKPLDMNPDMIVQMGAALPDVAQAVRRLGK